MRRLIPALLFGVSASEYRGTRFRPETTPAESWSLGGFGSVVYPGMGHAPTATPPVGQFRNSGFGNPGGGFSRGFANPGRASHPQHGATVIVPYPVYYGGYYGYDPSAAGYQNGYAPGYGPGNGAPYQDDGSQSGPGLPSVVINQNFVPPQANPQVRDYTGDQPPQQRSIGAEAVPGAAFASLCRCSHGSDARPRATSRPSI